MLIALDLDLAVWAPHAHTQSCQNPKVTSLDKPAAVPLAAATASVPGTGTFYFPWFQEEPPALFFAASPATVHDPHEQPLLVQHSPLTFAAATSGTTYDPTWQQLPLPHPLLTVAPVHGQLLIHELRPPVRSAICKLPYTLAVDGIAEVYMIVRRGVPEHHPRDLSFGFEFSVALLKVMALDPAESDLSAPWRVWAWTCDDAMSEWVSNKQRSHHTTLAVDMPGWVPMHGPWCGTPSGWPEDDSIHTATGKSGPFCFFVPGNRFGGRSKHPNLGLYAQKRADKLCWPDAATMYDRVMAWPRWVRWVRHTQSTSAASI